MIGIEINFESTYEKILYDLLKGIDSKKYNWNIVQQEIFYEDDLNMTLGSYLSKGMKFEEAIHDKGDYFVYFLNVQLYPKNAKESDIDTYDDFVKSDCELIVLFYDNSYIEFYIKSEYLWNIIMKNLKEKNIKYQVKTRENDTRTEMYV